MERGRPLLGDPFVALRDFVAAGGKRLRPAFCACAFVGAGGDVGSDAVIDAAAALELVHTFALVHDDIMDGSDIRRGRDAVHRRFARRHEEGEWRGPARRFGDGWPSWSATSPSVYADILLRGAPPTCRPSSTSCGSSSASGSRSTSSAPPRLAPTPRPCAGSPPTSRASTRWSGRCTSAPRLAGRHDELAGVSSAIGLPMGEAFQLRDDVLGAFGETAVTGKPVGDDLREGKPTPLVAIATARASERDRALLARLGSADLSAADVEGLQAVFVRTGAARRRGGRDRAAGRRGPRRLAAAPLTETAWTWLDELGGLRGLAGLLEHRRRRTGDLGRRVRKSYGPTHAVDGLDFDVAVGEVFGLLGPNGAGKTTTVEILEGYRRPDVGSARGARGSIPYVRGSPSRPQIGVMLQAGGLILGSARSSCCGCSPPDYDGAEAPEAMLDLVGLTGSVGTPVRRLSGGQAQRLSLVCAPSGGPAWCSSTSRPRAWTRRPARRRGTSCGRCETAA